MTVSQSYLDKTFLVNDGDARIRRDGNLVDFVLYAAGEPLPPGRRVGDPKIIPKGTTVRAVEARVGPNATIFARVQPTDAGAPVLGWTSSRNLESGFLNETIREIPPSSNDQQGDNAAWQDGNFIRQMTLIEIVGDQFELKLLAQETAAAYLALAAAAGRDDVELRLSSGFRSYARQKELYEGYTAHKPGYNLAAPPGRSNHQNGHAFDIVPSDRAYAWLAAHGPGLGFVRTVNGERWHWEYQPTLAADLAKTGRFMKDGVTT